MTAPAFLRVTAVTSGTERVIDRLIRVERAATDLTPIWPHVVRAFRAIEVKTFESEGASTDAGAWPELAERTQEDRARKGFPPAHPILQRTHKLQRALTLGIGAYERMTATSLQIQLSSELDYYKYHQSTAPRRKLPRRAPVSLTEADRQALMRPIRLYVTGHDPSAPMREAVR
jgi:hypothetical protein